MFEKLGIVTNIWAKRLEAGDSFEDLTGRFHENGFNHMEVRDGPYLRNTEFGRFLDTIEAAMQRYSDPQWKMICDNKEQLRSSTSLFNPEDQALFFRIEDFAAQTADVTFSYAMEHPWMNPPENMESDNAKIIQAKKLAYLLCPTTARLRFVDTRFAGPVDDAAAIANLKRYRSLLKDFPVILCIEHSKVSATRTLELVKQGGVLLAYDEANIYDVDGSTLNSPGEFWSMAKTDDFASVHIKQKTESGVLPGIEDGFVDFKTMLQYLKKGGYTEDLLFENAPSDQPLQNAIQSREYLLNL